MSLARKPMSETEHRRLAESTRAAAEARPGPRPAQAAQAQQRKQVEDEAIDRWGGYVESVVAPAISAGEQAISQLVAKYPNDPNWKRIQQLHQEGVIESQRMIASIHGILAGGESIDQPDFDSVAVKGLEAFDLIDQAQASNEDKLLASKALSVFSTLRQNKVQEVIRGQG